MRIAALGFHHETNTFQSVKTDYDAFAGYEFLRGRRLLISISLLKPVFQGTSGLLRNLNLT